MFAGSAVLLTGLAAMFAYHGVRSALEREFELRLERIARRAASQIAPADVRDPRARSNESAAYTTLQTLIGPLPATADVVNASIVDSARVTLVDAIEREEAEGLPSGLDSLAHPAFERAFGGRAAVSVIFRRGDAVRRAAIAPIFGAEGRVVGVVAIEAEAAYLPALSELGRTLALIFGLGALAMVVLGVLFARVTASASSLERQLSRAENLAAMGRMTATLAHEIKNPLAIIRGSAERLGKLEPEAQRMAQFVIEESDRLSRTVGRYLHFAKGDTSGGEVGDAIAALDATCELLEGEMRSRSVALERAAVATGAVRVRLDNESLKQVYLNLMLNALEAMPQGGTLQVGTTTHGSQFEIAIADTGSGMPPEVLQKIGSPFFTTKVTGSGLGLFLTRRLVQSAGGKLEFESVPGHGTRSVIRLPRADA